MTRTLTVFATCLVMLASACDSGSGSTPTARGVLVIPATDDATALRALAAMRGDSVQFRMDNCPNIPDGYQPLVGASMSFRDVADEPVGSEFSSNSCGAFSAAIPSGAVEIQALSEGFLPIKTDVSLFSDAAGTPALASTIPETATYRIGALQSLDDNRIGFTVTDTVSGLAVLGLSRKVFSITLDGADAELESVEVASASSAQASTVMVLDASRSMDDEAYTDPDTGESLDRRQLATLAAHLFLDQKDPDDEVAAMLFSRDLFFMNQETLDETVPLVNELGETVSYVLAEDGFETDASRLRLVIDSYNRQSDLYAEGGDPRHPDTPDDLFIPVSYPFEGATAVYDAIGESIAELAMRNALRPVVVAMTDGDDNRSRRGVQTVIDESIEANVPVYTIGFGGDTEVDVLTRIADETGGSFFNVTSIDIANVYQSIQTGILFQYIAMLSDGGIADAFTLGIRLNHNGVQVERTLDLSR